MKDLPKYLLQDEAFFYCPKSNIRDIIKFEQFVPLSDLLENAEVSNAFYNVIGQINGKNVIVI